MTKQNKMNPFKNSSSCDGAQQQQQPTFQVVLIDLKKVASDKEIVCVEKPLDDPQHQLNYVAISYRWGELQEEVIDTKVGYTAVVTSFFMHDFYELCRMMTKEVDLKHMDYVWVDAICVDQTNHDKRKATIHQMTRIYERATYILAVPDLHKRHLIHTSTIYYDIIWRSYRYGHDLYHLIHGNKDQLECIEEKWLHDIHAPDDRALRHLLKTSTDYFTSGFMTYREHHFYYNDEDILDHIDECSQREHRKGTTTDHEHHHHGNSKDSLEIERFHHCNQADCPLDLSHVNLPTWRQDMIHQNGRQDNRTWQQWMQERSISMRRSMNFMADLIKDWSQRVWVISEYNIAKTKNNMKYWFTQLYLNETQLTFFKFDFDNASFSASIESALAREPNIDLTTLNDPVYLTFHQTMLTQLNNQTFFEMLLKSKASKHEDRFYAIFPQTEYKNKITDKAMIDDWKIDTLGSVKLKLFEVLNIKDKLNFLFFSSNGYAFSIGRLLPTFATTSLTWHVIMEYMTLKHINYAQCNFDLTSPSTITLLYNSEKDLAYLHLKPKEYYVNKEKYNTTATTTLWSCLQSEDPYKTNVVVCIPCYIIPLHHQNTEAITSYNEDFIKCRRYAIYLNGNFEKNAWILQPKGSLCDNIFNVDCWEHHISDDDHISGFHIY